MIIGSTVNENHNDTYRKSGNKNVQAQAQRITQQAVQIRAGGNFSALVGGDLALVASQLKAGDEAYLVAGGKVQLLAEQDYDYSFYEKKKKGSWGSKSLKSDEHTRITHVGSSISSGGDLILLSGDEQRYQAAKLNSGGDLTLDSGAGIVFEGVKDREQKSRIRSNNSWVWQSSEGKGNTDETLLQSQLQAQGEIAIRAAEKIQIDIQEVNQQSISQTIDAMVQADPQLAWLKEMEQRADVGWHQVKELHDSFKYSQSGLSGPAAIVIAIVVTYLTAGAASGAIGSTVGATAGSGTAMAAGTVATATTAATSAGFANVALTAMATSVASNTVISSINNKGDLGSVINDVTSSDALKGYATSAAIAGLGSYTEGWGRELTADGNYKLINAGQRLKAYAANTALKGLLTGDDSAKSWLTIAGTGALMELYQYSVGREPDARPGVERPDGAKFDESLGYVPRVFVNGEWRDGNNIGLNRFIGEPGCKSFFSVCHGSTVSSSLNVMPGFNSFATLHDQWMIDLFNIKGNHMNVFENIGSMTPAFIVNYGSLYEKYKIEAEQAKKINKSNRID